jgi:hypothetical protein
MARHAAPEVVGGERLELRPWLDEERPAESTGPG